MAKAQDSQENQGEQPTAAPVKDLAGEIGTLTYARAVQNFGRENALEVMHEVARLGGHGMFEDTHFTSPLFGGLAMPDPDAVLPPQKVTFSKLPDGEFRYQMAVEEQAVVKEQTVAARNAINEYYAGLK